MPIFNINISDPCDQFNNLGCSTQRHHAAEISNSAKEIIEVFNSIKELQDHKKI